MKILGNRKKIKGLLEKISKLPRMIVESFYLMFFVRKIFYKLNKCLFCLGAHGIGILNYKTKKKTGEKYFIDKVASIFENKKITVFDIGANVGDYSRLILQKKSNVFIYAFEPHPDAFDKLKIFAQDKVNVHLINKGCGNENARVSFYNLKDKNESELSSLYKDVITDLHKSEYSESKVDIIKLDDFCQQNNIEKIDLLKIDTEGSEFQVIMGAKNIIEKGYVSIIHFEFNSMNIISRSFFKDFYDFLKEYSFFRLLPDGAVFLGKYDPLLYEIFSFQNIIAIRKDLLEKIKI